MKAKRGKKLSGSGINKIEAGVYCIRVTAVDPRSGKLRERQQKIEAQSYEDAAKARDALRHALKADLAAEATGTATGATSRETIAEFSKTWLAHLRETRRCRPHAIDKNERTLSGLILPHLGGVKLGDLNRAHLATYLGWLGQRRLENGEPYATATLRGAWAVLRTLLRDAVALANLPTDPTTGVKFQVKGAPAKERAFLDAAQLAKLLRAADNESADVRAMLLLGFSTGLRFSELSALTWDDVNLSEGFVHVRRSQVYGHIDETKSPSSNRVVPLLPALVDALREHQAWQKRNCVRGLERGILFPSKAGTYRTAGMLRKPLRRCAVAAELPVTMLSSHVMRRTFNNLARTVADRIVLQSMTGHSTEAMSAHYSTVSLAEKKAAQQQALGLLLPSSASPGTSTWDPKENTWDPSGPSGGAMNENDESLRR